MRLQVGVSVLLGVEFISRLIESPVELELAVVKARLVITSKIALKKVVIKHDTIE
jgi:hypothetical protein